MSGFTPLIILILSMVILLLLQVTPGIFAIFYHFALGKNSIKKSDDYALNFIAGTEIFYGLMWLLSYTIIFAFFYNTEIPIIIVWTLAGIFFALSIVSFCFYYKKTKKSSATFVPRHIVRGIIARSERTNSRLDAGLLGFFANVPELFFTLPLLLICSIILQTFITIPHAVFIIVAVILSTIPLFVIRHFYRTGYNLADIIRFRIKIKPYIRIALAITFLLIAIFSIMYGVYYG